MNLFRLVGDMAHLASFLVLLLAAGLPARERCVLSCRYGRL